MEGSVPNRPLFALSNPNAHWSSVYKDDGPPNGRRAGNRGSTVTELECEDHLAG